MNMFQPIMTIRPFNLVFHLVDDRQNAKDIFCVLSFKFNLFITPDSFYNSKILSLFMSSNNDAIFQTQLTVTTERKREI